MFDPEETWNEAYRKDLEIGQPPQNSTLRPENCSDIWPAFVIKHGLRQKEGESVSAFICRFCNNINDFPADWLHFACPETARALFCLGGFRNIWLRGIVERGCQVPRNINEIKACLVDFIPYFGIAQREKRVRANRVKKGLRRKRNLSIYPWEYMHYNAGETVLRVSLAVWGLRPLQTGEKLTHEPLRLN